MVALGGAGHSMVRSEICVVCLEVVHGQRLSLGNELRTSAKTIEGEWARDDIPTDATANSELDLGKRYQ